MPSKSNLWAVVAMALAAVCVFIAMKLADYAGGLELVNAWTKDLGVLGMVLFALLSGVSVVFFFPGSILMTASGAAFGLRDGFIVALVATSVGAALAFLVSRYLARKRIGCFRHQVLFTRPKAVPWRGRSASAAPQTCSPRSSLIRRPTCTRIPP